MPRRDILLDCKLVVRESCGAEKSAGESSAPNPKIKERR
jgi:hypothetical protein